MSVLGSMKLGLNLASIGVASNDTHTPDLVSTYMGNQCLNFHNIQTTITAKHLNGSGIFILSTINGLANFGTTATGDTHGVTAQITDSGPGGNNNILKISGYVVTGTNVMVVTSFTSGVDQDVQIGGIVDNLNPGNSVWANAQGQPLNAVYVDSTGRDTGYPNGLNAGQSFSIDASPALTTTGPTGGYNSYPAGNYTLLCAGTGTISIGITYYDGSVKNFLNIAVTNGVPAQSVFPATLPVFQVQLVIKASTNGNPIRDCRFILPDRPGYTDNFVATYLANQSNPSFFLFHPDFLSIISGYDTIRYMVWEAANGQQAINIATDCNLPQLAPTYDSSKPFPHQWECQLSNQTNTNMWICIPALANDNYITSMAQLLCQQLSTNLKVYIEYSNETWNDIFNQAYHCQNMGLANFSFPVMTSLTYSSGTGLCTGVLTAHGFSTNNSINIAGATDANYNGVFSITVVDANTFTYTPTSPPGSATAVATTYGGLMAVSTTDTVARVISSLTWTWTSGSTKLNVTTSTSHGLSSGDGVLITNCSDNGFNGIWVNITVLNSTSFTIPPELPGEQRTCPVATTTSTTATALPGLSMMVYRLGANAQSGKIVNVTTVQDKYAGRKSYQVHSTFATAWVNAGGDGTRLRRVVGTQAGGGSRASNRFTQYLADQAVGGPLPGKLGLAYAPYYFATPQYTDSSFLGSFRTISSLTYSSGTGLCTATTSGAHGLSTGQSVQVFNARTSVTGQIGYSGVFTITVTGTTTFTYTPVVAPTVTPATSGTLLGSIQLSVGSNFREIITMTISGGVVTCTSYGHGYSTGQILRVAGVLRPMEYNNYFQITVVDANTFTFALPNVTASPTTYGASFNPFCYDIGQIYLLTKGALNHINTNVVSFGTGDQTSATTFGTEIYCYESGQSLLPTTANQNWAPLADVYCQQNRDPSCYGLYLTYFKTVSLYGVSLCNQFESLGAYDRFGSWGFAEYPTQPSTVAPKRSALLQLLNQNPPQPQQYQKRNLQNSGFRTKGITNTGLVAAG